MANVFNAKYSNIARPYALAAFEFARDSKQLPLWKSFLDAASFAVDHDVVRKFLANPEVTSARLLALFEEVLQPILHQEQQNFLRLLAQNKRFALLPEITAHFNDYYATYEKISTVRVVTAIEANAQFKEKLNEVLTKRLQHHASLRFEVDPSIIAGAVIHIGDRVIDGSVSGKLSRLLKSMSN